MSREESGELDRRLLCEVRGRLGLTQSGLARVLRVSPKAIQSYEQGWRNPPQGVAVHLLTLLALRAGHPEAAAPCWERRKCPDTVRHACAASALGCGRFCWLVTGGCYGSSPRARLAGCLRCAVTQSFRAALHAQADGTQTGRGRPRRGAVHDRRPQRAPARPSRTRLLPTHTKREEEMESER